MAIFIIDGFVQLDLPRVDNHNFCCSWNASICALFFDCLDDAFAIIHDSSKNDISATEPLGFDSGDKELRSIGIGTGICHGQEEFAVEFDRGQIFILEVSSIDTISASTVVSYNVATLDKAVGNDTMKETATIAESGFTSIASTQSSKVFDGLGGDSTKETQNNATDVNTINLYLQPDLVCDGRERTRKRKGKEETY
jgi:hypothetical protein